MCLIKAFSFVGNLESFCKSYYHYFSEKKSAALLISCKDTQLLFGQMQS